jgi:hypothetical protein
VNEATTTDQLAGLAALLGVAREQADDEWWCWQ